MPVISKQDTRPAVKRSKSVIDRISPIGFDEDDGIKILLYGKSGTGKTTLWATFPGPILAVVCSGGNKPGELRSINTAEYRKKVQQVALESTAELKEIVDYVAESKKFKTVVLDHTTGYQDLTLREILGLEELPAQKSWGMATQQQYGQSSMKCKEGFRALLELDANVVFISQERTFGGQAGEEGAVESDLIKPYVSAANTPAVTGWLAPACDYVCQTFIRPKMLAKSVTIGGKEVQQRVRGKGVEYCLRTEPHEVFQTKFRVPRGKELPSVIVDPSYQKIMELIEGE